MKNNNWLKLCLVSAMALIICYGASAQSTNTTDLNQEELAHWYGTYTWLNGLKLTPHTSINQQEFSIQYHKQPEWWDKAFEFLKSNDLNTLQTGRYVIVPDHVTAFVSEGPVKEKEAINWETHANFNDLQYIITGRAEMGITSVDNPNAKVITPYNDKLDTETYAVEGGDYYVAMPGTFFIFSPKDIHRPAFKVQGYDTVKKILIKVRVP